MKEKRIRQDIIESSTISYSIDNILKVYKKELDGPALRLEKSGNKEESLF